MRLRPLSAGALLGFALLGACGDPSDQDTSPHLSAPSAGSGGGAGTSGNVAFGGSAGASGSASASGAFGVAGSGGLAAASGAAGQGGTAGAAGGFGGLAGTSGGVSVAGGGTANGGAGSGSGGAAMTDPVPDAKFDAAWAVFKPRCSMCHGDAAEKFGGSDRQAAFTAALIYKEEIARRIGLSRPSFDAMPPSAALPASELSAVKAWLATVVP